MSSIRRGRGALLSAGVALTLLAACTSETGSATTTPTSGPGSSSASGAELTRSESLTVITHDSFALSDEVKRQFESDTGMTVTYVAPGDAGSMVNQLILTKDAPLGGVVFRGVIAGREQGQDQQGEGCAHGVSFGVARAAAPRSTAYDISPAWGVCVGRRRVRDREGV